MTRHAVASAPARMPITSSHGALVVFTVAAAACAGALSVQSMKLSVLALTVLIGLAVVARRPVILAMVALAGVYGSIRLGSGSFQSGGSGGISYSDVLVTAAFLMAVPALLGTRSLARLRTAGAATAIYLASLLAGVIATPSTTAYLEWTHRLVLVGGAMLVGAWLVQEHAVTPALRLLSGASFFLALAAIQYTLTHHLVAAYPFGMHKNFVGSLLGLVLLLLLIVPGQVKLPPALHWAAVVLIGAGLFACQSRGAMLGTAFGLLVAFVLGGRMHSWRTRIFVVLAALALVMFAYQTVTDQLEESPDQLKFNSAGVRSQVEAVTRDIWRTSPIVGVGLKYFNAGDYGPLAIAPTNIIDNELAESGLIGAAGFIALQGIVLTTLFRRRRAPFALAALAVASGELLHGMFDTYWIAGPVTLSFIVVGMALADTSQKRASQSDAVTPTGQPWSVTSAGRSGAGLR